MTHDGRRTEPATEPMETYNVRVPHGFAERLRKLRGHLMMASGDYVAPGRVLDALVRDRLMLADAAEKKGDRR